MPTRTPRTKAWWCGQFRSAPWLTLIVRLNETPETRQGLCQASNGLDNRAARHYVAAMTAPLETVSGLALDLPPAQRLSLARALIESVDGSDDISPEAAWDSEIRARLERFKSGETTSIAAADVFRRLREVAPGR